MSVIGSLATWYFWAYYAAGLAIMTGTLALHLRTSPTMGKGPWLLVLGGALGALGSISGGRQAGPYPPMYAHNGVAVIRLLWVSGVSLGVIASGMYLWGLKERKE